MSRVVLAVLVSLLALTSAVPHFRVDNEPAVVPLVDLLPANVRLGTYKYTNCGTPSYIANLSELVLTPDPISFPGPLNVEFKLNVKSEVNDGFKGNVLMEKKVGSTWIKVPCLGNIGSCTYDDICSLLAMIPACPDPFVQAGIPCKCPFNAGNYHLPTASFEVDIPIFPPGDLHINANLTYQDKPVACADIYATFT